MGVFVFLSMTSGRSWSADSVLATFFGAVLGLAVGIVIESVLGLDPPNTTNGVLESNGAAWVAVAMLFFLWWLAVVAIYLELAQGRSHCGKRHAGPGPSCGPAGSGSYSRLQPFTAWVLRSWSLWRPWPNRFGLRRCL